VSEPAAREVTEKQSKEREIVADGRGVRRERERALVARERLIVSPEVGERIATIVHRHGIVRSDRERPVEARERVAGSSYANEGYAAIVERLRIGWHKRECAVERRDRLFQVTEIA
jgi:hypothetical protein